MHRHGLVHSESRVLLKKISGPILKNGSSSSVLALCIISKFCHLLSSFFKRLLDGTAVKDY